MSAEKEGIMEDLTPPVTPTFDPRMRPRPTVYVVAPIPEGEPCGCCSGEGHIFGNDRVAETCPRCNGSKTDTRDTYQVFGPCTIESVEITLADEYPHHTERYFVAGDPLLPSPPDGPYSPSDVFRIRPKASRAAQQHNHRLWKAREAEKVRYL